VAIVLLLDMRVVARSARQLYYARIGLLNRTKTP